MPRSAPEPNSPTATISRPTILPGSTSITRIATCRCSLRQSWGRPAPSSSRVSSRTSEGPPSGVGDDVMIIHDIPANFITSSAPALPYAAVLAQRNGGERGPTAACASSTIDPRIDRDNEISCNSEDPDTGGGAAYGRLLLNGALVQETPAFPPARQPGPSQDDAARRTPALADRQRFRHGLSQPSACPFDQRQDPGAAPGHHRVGRRARS